jgi:hypothetical protein
MTAVQWRKGVELTVNEDVIRFVAVDVSKPGLIPGARLAP